MENQKNPCYSWQNRSGIVGMLETAAEDCPDADAFRLRVKKDQAGSRTYSKVLRDVRRLAGRIPGRGRHVAVIGENSYDWLTAFFAVLGSGNVAVPIDRALPAREIAGLIREADVSAAFVSQSYADLTEGIPGLTVWPMKRPEDEGEEQAEAFSLVHPGADDPACIFFTSGTSGASKGVVLTHGNLAAEISSCAKQSDLEGESAFSILPFHHTYGLVASVLVPYLSHTPVFICSSLKRMTEDLALAKPSFLVVVPLFVENLYKQITEGIKKTGRNLLEQMGVRLRFIVCGGAFLDPRYVKAFREFGIEILNGYGTTECSPAVSMNQKHHHRDGSVGQLLPGVEARISGEGEVLIRGPIVMKEYYKRPEETAQVLRDGWYATGDLGYIDEDGFLFLTGRMKELIILSNGENISPEELEADFQRDPGVKSVLVCERDGLITAEIFPEEGFEGQKPYFETLMRNVNRDRPAYKQVARVALRDHDFIRNSTQKIVRYKNIPGPETPGNGG